LNSAAIISVLRFPAGKLLRINSRFQPQPVTKIFGTAFLDNGLFSPFLIHKTGKEKGELRYKFQL